MHEFSVASGILDKVLEESGKRKASRVKRISIGIGQLAMIPPEQMAFAMGVLSEGTIAEGAEIDCDIIPLKVECEKKHISEVKVGEEGLYSAIRKLKCPECNGNVKIIGGRECVIREIIDE